MDIKYEGKVVWSKGAAERTGPSVNNPSVRTLAVNAAVQGVVLSIEEAGVKEWMQLTDGNWIATIYPNSSGAPQVRVEYHDVTVPIVRFEGIVVFPRGAAERTGPSASFPSVNTLPVDTPVQGIAVSVEQAGVKEWLQLLNGHWVAAIYPNSSGMVEVRVDYHEISPSGSTGPLKAVITMPNGEQWVATRFTRVVK